MEIEKRFSEVFSLQCVCCHQGRLAFYVDHFEIFGLGRRDTEKVWDKTSKYVKIFEKVRSSVILHNCFSFPIMSAVQQAISRCLGQN